MSSNAIGYLAEAALAENFDEVEVVDVVLPDSRSASSWRFDGRSQYAAAAAGRLAVDADDTHPRPRGAGRRSTSTRLSVLQPRRGSFNVGLDGRQLGVRHQHHLARVTAQYLVHVRVNVIVVAVLIV